MQERQCGVPRCQLRSPLKWKRGQADTCQYELETPTPESKSKEAEAKADEADEVHEMSRTQAEKIRKTKAKAEVVVKHVDIIKDEFWDRRPWLLSNKPGRLPAES